MFSDEFLSVFSIPCCSPCPLWLVVSEIKRSTHWRFVQKYAQTRHHVQTDAEPSRPTGRTVKCGKNNPSCPFSTLTWISTHALGRKLYLKLIATTVLASSKLACRRRCIADRKIAIRYLIQSPFSELFAVRSSLCHVTLHNKVSPPVCLSPSVRSLLRPPAALLWDCLITETSPPPVPCHPAPSFC